MPISDTLRDKLSHYRPSSEAADALTRNSVVLLVGISGAGKDTLKHRLLHQYSNRYHHIVSHTTRSPRTNKGVMEQNGVDYHFIDFAAAEHMLDNRAFIEAKEYSGNVYGTSVAEFQLAHDEGKVAVTDLEVQGVAEYVKLAPSVKPIFILPPNFKAWQERMISRYGGPLDGGQDNVDKRIATAKQELLHALETDYFHFVINDDLDVCMQQIHHIATDPSGNFTTQIVADRVIHELLSRL